MSGVSPILPLVLGAVLSVGCLVGAFWSLRRKRLIDDLPTSKTQGVFVGLCELKGTAESEQPLVSYLAGARCVYYKWHVDEHWSRTVHETYTDSKGQVHTRTRTESGWKKVADGGGSAPFYLKDETGAIRIIPDEAQINAIGTFDETLGRSDPVYFSKGPTSEIANSTHRRRFQESALPLHVPLYILGHARQRDDVPAAEIAADKDAIFLISTKTERQISSGYGIWAFFWVLFGAVLVAGGAFASNLAAAGGAGWGVYVLAGGGYLLALLLGWTWMVYNSLVTLHQRVAQSWSQVDVQLKRRADLIPNLVAGVAAYRDYERSTQQAVAQLRQQAEATPPGEAGADYDGLSPVLRAVVERYPELKANEVFMGLQRSLVETEQRIALARDYFNDIATFYNNRLEIVPDRFVAGLARLRPRTLMTAAGFERASIEVKLAD